MYFIPFSRPCSLCWGDPHFNQTFFFQWSPLRTDLIWTLFWNLLLLTVNLVVVSGHETLAPFSFCHGRSPTLIYLYSQQLSLWISYTSGMGREESDAPPPQIVPILLPLEAPYSQCPLWCGVCLRLLKFSCLYPEDIETNSFTGKLLKIYLLYLWNIGNSLNTHTQESSWINYGTSTQWSTMYL